MPVWGQVGSLRGHRKEAHESTTLPFAPRGGAVYAHFHGRPCHAVWVLPIGVNLLWLVMRDKKASARCLITTFWVIYPRWMPLLR